MAESKPTKLQMAKEIQYLIAAAQDMSAVMDLDPPIKTDYLIDLKNKTVTVSHLNHVIGSLQADMKAVAVEIEPEDKFQPDTHRVLADLNVKVPRPAAKEEVVEDEDDIMPTPSPPITEDVKPVKKEKKTKSISGCTFVGHLVCDDMDMDFETIRKKVDEAGYTISDSTIRTIKTDVGKIVAYLKETGRIK